MRGLIELSRNQRARHVAVAAGFALLIGALGLLNPLNSLIWVAQSRVNTHAASGEVVFIGTTEDVTDTSAPQRRIALARLIDLLDRGRPARSFLDMVIDRPSSERADQTLAHAIADAPNLFLVRRHMMTVGGDETVGTVAEIAGDAPQVVSKEWVDAFGFTWELPFAVRDEGTSRTSLSAAIAGVSGSPDNSFRPDYSIDYRTVPTFTASEATRLLTEGGSAAREAFAGKVVVIGSAATTGGGSASIPGFPRVPGSIVAILGAETLKAGLVPVIGWLPILAVTCALMLAISLAGLRPFYRRHAYIAVVAIVLAITGALVYYRSPANVAVTGAFLAIYGAVRLWVARQRATALIDERSGLPTFKSLERDLDEMRSVQSATVVVARVHHFDEILSALPAESHAEYINLIADRLRITQPDLDVYTSGGRHLAWTVRDHGDARLEAHLRGLRAVFSSPVSVSGTAVDVVITFGVDATSEASALRKIASAISAADKTSEALAPIQFAHAASEADRIWSISLQAKIDEALQSGQIYVVYQPQIEIATGRIVGAEALVRWEDPDRGAIAPSYFIEQCEQAGRMEALTKKVVNDAIGAFAKSDFAKMDFGMSINVSATLLNDHRIAEIVEAALALHRVDASQITLEITETARIVDYDKARLIMDRLHRIGVKLSVDDFGIGAASLETFHMLPFDELKIDRSFVSTVDHDPKARKIIESLMLLSEGLNLTVVAEGVEDAVIARSLVKCGCRIAQGYYFARPSKFSDLLSFEAIPRLPQDRRATSSA